MRYKGVLFDLDGTLLDTLEDLGSTLNHVLSAHGYPVRTMAEYRAFVGNGARLLTKRALPEGTPEDEVERIFREYRDYYRDHPCAVTVPYEGMTELIGQLQQGGMAVAVVSNKPDPTTKALISRFFPGILAVGDDGVHPRKPAPDNIYRTLALLGVAPEEAIYVGDSEVDLATARNTGMDAAIVSWGYRNREELLSCGVTEPVGSAAELRDRIFR